LIKFFSDAREHLSVDENDPEKAGFIFVKENVKIKKFAVDKDDNSFVRTVKNYEAVFVQAGLRVSHFEF